MKSYAIYDEDLNRKAPIGYLFYYEKADSFIIELCEDLDEWEAPLLFQKHVREGRYTILHEESLLWVKERVIPSGRQNIGTILKNHKLKEYKEMSLLALSKGRCAQDSCYIVEISEAEIPSWIQEKKNKNVRDCFITEDKNLLCLFWDDTVRKIESAKLIEKYNKLSYILKSSEMIDSIKVGIGGYSVAFQDILDIPISDLIDMGVLIPLSANDFYGFVRKNVVDASEAAFMLECSRQNLSYLVREGKLNPILRGTKENLYVKGELERVRTE